MSTFTEYAAKTTDTAHSHAIAAPPALAKPEAATEGVDSEHTVLVFLCENLLPKPAPKQRAEAHAIDHESALNFPFRRWSCSDISIAMPMELCPSYFDGNDGLTVQFRK